MKISRIKIFVFCIVILIFDFSILHSVAHASTLGIPKNFRSLSSGLVGYWSMDGKDVVNGVLQDKSGNANNAQLFSISTSTFYTLGKIGQAANFDGVNDYADAGHASSLNDIQSQGGGGMTIAFWIKPRSDISTTIIGKGIQSNTNGFWFVGKDSSTDPARLVFYKEGVTDLNTTYNSTLVPNVWQHIVVEWTGSMLITGVTAYKNGVALTQTSSANGATADTDASDDLTLGADVAPSQFTDGALDDVRIYKRLLSTQEITDLYNLGTAKFATTRTGTGSPVSNGLVGFYTMDGKDIVNGVYQDRGTGANNANTIAFATSTGYVTGKIGQGINLNGSTQYLKTSTVTSLPGGATARTLAAWIKPVGNGGTVIAENSSSLKFIFQDFFTAGSWNIFTDGINVGNNLTITGSQIPPVGKWSHIALTMDGANHWTYYLNGASTTSGTFGTAINTSALTSLTIGERLDTGGQEYKGTIDDARVYNRALSQQEVADLYNLNAEKFDVTNTASFPPLSNGLVGWWTFDGKDMTNGVAQDRSGNGNNGTLINIATSTFYAQGKIGQGFRFNGTSNYVDVGANSSLNLTGALSISFWLNIPDTTLTLLNVIAKGSVGSGASGEQYYVSLERTGGTGNVEFGVSNGTTILNTVTSDNTISNNKWAHVVAIYDGVSQVCIYVNGVSKGCNTSAGLGTLNSDGNNVYLGANSFFASQYLKGTLDDVRIYNRALSVQEVGALYNQAK